MVNWTLDLPGPREQGEQEEQDSEPDAEQTGRKPHNGSRGQQREWQPEPTRSTQDKGELTAPRRSPEQIY